MPDFEPYDEDPGIDGPDYVALVIEFPDDAAITEEITDEVTRPTQRTLARERAMRIATGALGAAIAVGLVAWGVRRLRA